MEEAPLCLTSSATLQVCDPIVSVRRARVWGRKDSHPMSLTSDATYERQDSASDVWAVEKTYGTAN